ncbi:MAG: hypothetical protein AABW68_04355 [archaeon]
MDFIYPSAVSGRESPSFILHDSLAQFSTTSFPTHTRGVFLPSLDRAEVQRCVSQKVPCMVSLHSLSNASESLKVSGLRFVHLDLNGPPLIDYAWMSGAHDAGLEVVFSLPDLRESFHRKHVNGFQEYRKISRLLSKTRIPLHVASFARVAEEVLSLPEQRAWYSYLGYGPAGDFV